MGWIPLLVAFLASFVAAFGGFLLADAWKRRRRASQLAIHLDGALPGHDCGLCGEPSCRDFALALEAGVADPARCCPGGDATEARIREIFAEAGLSERSAPMRAVVRCGGSGSRAVDEFAYDGRRDCASAVRLYGGPKRCKDACIGLGSCLAACPLGAIRIAEGIARIDAELCSGCGACVPACPTGSINLVPRSVEWIVACSSRIDRNRKKTYCSAACIACNECSRRSNFAEFSLVGELAAENPKGPGGGSEREIAASCPTAAIVGIDPKKTSSLLPR